ncbi:MAG TPA: serine hydrolase domain-containing protein [Acidimicrobiales bacterium]|nr:serine hydrolase domain-containing protein [Acidimicrobiales bacterium]
MAAADVTVEGRVAAGWEPVREAFAANFAERGDVGAACAVYLDGSPVVDLWGGVADGRAGRDWSADTMALVYSTTKGLTAVVAHMLAAAGAVDLDAPVCDLWPEYSAGGKGATTLRHMLAHRAGLPTFEPALASDQALAWRPAVEALARQAPRWEPGSRHGYHAVTYGWLVGEVLRRATGSTVGQLLAEHVGGPLGADCFIGLPEHEEPRVARLLAAPAPAVPGAADLAELPPGALDRLAAYADPASLTMRALNPTTPPFNFNSREVHAAELPAANGVATARSLARVYAATIGAVDGVRLLDAATLADATAEQSAGPDAVLLVPTRFGSGFQLASEFSPLLGPASFGHSGAGGSLAFADPDAGVGFAYVMNQMQQNLSGDPRTAALIGAVRACLA